MTLYGPLPAQRFLQLLKRLTAGTPDRSYLEEVLDGILSTLEAERGLLLKVKPGGEVRVLASRHQDRTDVANAREAVSQFAVRQALSSPERFHHARQAARDRRYRTEEHRRGRRRVRSILALALALGADAGASADYQAVVYLDHRFQDIEFSENRRITVEHWLSLLELALRFREREFQFKRQERLARRSPGDGKEPEAAGDGPVPSPAAEPVEFFGLWTRSPAMLEIIETVKRLAASEIPVLVSGETGTGKGLLVKAIHLSSRRAGAPFISVNCGALPDNLLESELFGHARGAFTGAEADRPGLLLESDGGTLFLDEIGDMSGEMQKKLLRFLENRRFRPLGGKREVKCDARILSATRLDLREELERGRFRADLFYRLCGMSIRIPPLRERPEDIAGLAALFLRRWSAGMTLPAPELSPQAVRWLERYPWPGNVRELENLMRQVIALGHSEVSGAHLAALIRSDMRELAVPEKRFRLEEAVMEAERQAIRNALVQCVGNKSKAAGLLGITRKALYRRLSKYGLLKNGKARPKMKLQGETSP
ncbi:MAG: sigma 54-interacting transcriptional regulator [Planctomycetes bacterium]|nr:sigma 54-interacting transcriptional regulator [Planctomycetota bacterium]